MVKTIYRNFKIVPVFQTTLLENLLQIKAYDMTKLTDELKSDIVQYRNNMVYITVVVLFLPRDAHA